MIHKLERWAWWGGASLAVIAGVVNVVGLQSYTHQAITHVTGTTTLFSQALARGNGIGIAELALILVSFTLGSALGDSSSRTPCSVSVGGTASPSSSKVFSSSPHPHSWTPTASPEDASPLSPADCRTQWRAPTVARCYERLIFPECTQI